ncbi:MAG: NmrA family NAD(P)-binding protein [Muribaculaceae bacterium]|nr:NmrA family NAD(P)-binding protein [Muribaculaceae bacterium]
MRILVTSSTGLTGKAVVKAMTSKGIEVIAMIHSDKKRDEMLGLGASETVAGDIASYDDLLLAMRGMDAVYYICPTAREDEAEIGKTAIEATKEAGINRFIYQSVLHSIEPELPHHRQKLEVERTLVDSGLVYTIVQPAPFMQNILNAKEALVNNKVFVQKFFTGRDSVNRINLIDVGDFGNCIAAIALDERFQYATLELCGPQNLSASEMLSTIENVVGQEIKLKYLTDDEIRRSMSERNAPEYSIETLLKMFHHYNNGDFCGSPFVTTALLKRAPTTFAEFLKRELK